MTKHEKFFSFFLSFTEEMFSLKLLMLVVLVVVVVVELLLFVLVKMNEQQ